MRLSMRPFCASENEGSELVVLYLIKTLFGVSERPPRAGLSVCVAWLRMSAIGTKRTSPSALHMSAFDPKRTSANISRCSSEVGFSPFQNANLIGYDAMSKAWGTSWPQ